MSHTPHRTNAEAVHAPSLDVLRLRLPAAPLPLVLRRDRLPTAERALDIGDVLRYVGAARRTLRGPVIVQIEGPGDPLASPSTVLRALSLLREHDPEVRTGLVIDGPLLGEYIDELLELELHHLVIRMDAACLKTARRVYGRVLYRGELLSGGDAGRLVLEEGRRAVYLAVRNHIPVALRFTAIPTVNLRDLPTIAAFAAWEGVERVDVVPHVPVAGAPLQWAGATTEEEIEACRDMVAAAYKGAHVDGVPTGLGTLSWLEPGRMKDVRLADLESVDPVSLLPDPDEDLPEGLILPPRKAQMVAVVSSDGEFVDGTLANAGQLRIYAVGSDRTRWLGTRPLHPSPGRRKDGVGDAQDFLHALSGCRAVVATRFSARASVLLNAVGIRATVASGPVDEVLDRVSRGTAPPPVDPS